MCKSCIVVSAVLYFVNADAFSSEDAPTFRYYGTSILDNPDINANSLTMLAGDTSPTFPLSKEDDSFFLGHTSLHFSEFQSISFSQTNPPTTTPTTTTTTVTTSLKPEIIQSTPPQNIVADNTNFKACTEADELTKVLPIPQKPKYQRGVLDLLFPAERVKNFKTMFDTVRRLLSHTF